MRVDFPELGSVAEVGPDEFLISFYQAIGWDRQSELDPKKIALNPEHWKDICSEYNQLEEGASGGIFFMSYGPSSDVNVPYGKVEIGDGAFNLANPALTEADKRSLDETVGYLFETDGNRVILEADRGESNEFLLQSAYDAAQERQSPQEFLDSLRGIVDLNWEESVDLAVDDAIERSGIVSHVDDRYDEAREYLTEKYSFEPPYDHYFDQPMKANILLGSDAESNLDFASVGNMRDFLLDPGVLSAEDLDNGLTWLVGQQGHSVNELRQAFADYVAQGFASCRQTHGPFLASVVSELDNFPNVMGTVTVLSELSINDMAKMLEQGATITAPRNATVGIFAPWVGGGSTFNIQLEKPLDIPRSMQFDVQIEGAGCSEYTVNAVYGLVPKAWKKPLNISASAQDRDKPLDDLAKEAKTRAAEKNVAHLSEPEDHKPPEIGR